MKLFMLGVLTAYATLFATMAVMERESLASADDPTWRTLTLSLLFLPVLITWLSAELLNVISPRKMFRNRKSSVPVRLFTGLAAGALAVGISVFALTLLVEYADDAVLIGASAACGTTLALLPLRKVRPGGCRHCDYDLSGNAGSSLCPECGADVMA